MKRLVVFFVAVSLSLSLFAAIFSGASAHTTSCVNNSNTTTQYGYRVKISATYCGGSNTHVNSINVSLAGAGYGWFDSYGLASDFFYTGVGCPGLGSPTVNVNRTIPEGANANVRISTNGCSTPWFVGYIVSEAVY